MTCPARVKLLFIVLGIQGCCVPVNIDTVRLARTISHNIEHLQRAQTNTVRDVFSRARDDVNGFFNRTYRPTQLKAALDVKTPVAEPGRSKPGKAKEDGPENRPTPETVAAQDMLKLTRALDTAERQRVCFIEGLHNREKVLVDRVSFEYRKLTAKALEITSYFDAVVEIDKAGQRWMRRSAIKKQQGEIENTYNGIAASIQAQKKSLMQIGDQLDALEGRQSSKSTQLEQGMEILRNKLMKCPSHPRGGRE